MFAVTGVTQGTVTITAYDNNTDEEAATITLNVTIPVPTLNGAIVTNDNNPMWAGNGVIITISGKGFGNTQCDANNNCGFVSFISADDDGQASIDDLDPFDYSSNNQETLWTDTEIKMYLPGQVWQHNVNGENLQKTIGSGNILITNSFGNTLNDNTDDYDNITITSCYNQALTSDGTQKYFYEIHRNPGANNANITFNVDDATNGLEILAIKRAMSDWNCYLSNAGYGINFSLNTTINNNIQNFIRHGMPSGYSSNTIMLTLPTQGFTYSDPTSTYAYNSAYTIYINTNENWDYILPLMGSTIGSGMQDFYNSILHELGHVLQLGHVNNTDELMYHTSDPNSTRVDFTTLGNNAVTDATVTVHKSEDLAWLLTSTVTCCPAPTSPTNLEATVQNSWEIDLNWTIPTPSDLDTYNPPSYLIERSSNASFTNATTLQTSANFIDDVGLNPSTSYYYQVFAVNTYAQSAPISIGPITTLSASNPASPSQYGDFVESNGVPTISWSGSGTNATTYTVLRSDSPDGPFKSIYTTNDSHTTNYTDQNVSQNQVYYYVIQSNNPDGSTTSSVKVVFTATTPCSSTANLNYTTTSTVPVVKYTTGTITAGTSVAIASGSAVEFLAGSKVILQPGYSALVGSYFKAEISGCGAISTIEQDSIKSDSPTNIDENKVAPVFNFYPNPTNGSITIVHNTNEPYNISIYNISGEIVKEVNNCLNKINVNISDKPSGIYIIKIYGQIDSFVGKLVKN